jgi:NADPH:quinone reductase-like Zn-dependent oxidoreductase
LHGRIFTVADPISSFLFMKTIVMTAFGDSDVLRLEERSRPLPARGQVLIRVEAIGVNPVDWRVRKGQLKEFVRQKPPLVLGAEIAGEIVELGADVQRFQVGDKVFAKLPGDIGGYAELLALDEKVVATRPANLNAIEAAAVPVGATTALQAIRDRAHLKPGQRILINGASGGVGLYAVQLARELGGVVTAVCSADAFPLVREMGAAEVIDYKSDDFTKLGKTWHVIFDVAATRKFGDCRRALEPGGVYVTTISGFGDILMPILNPFRSRKGRFIIVKCSQADLDYSRQLVESGKLRPVVEKVFPLVSAAEAQTYQETRRPKGKVILEV